MKKQIFCSLIVVLFMVMTCCSSYMDVYNTGNKKLHYYHGPKLQGEFISVTNISSEEVEFKIMRAPGGKFLYHFILDEEETRVSEGWFPTQLLTNEPEHYFVRMKAKKGFTFQPGKKYRLCVGFENPDAVYYRTSYYKCFIDFEFMVPEK